MRPRRRNRAAGRRTPAPWDPSTSVALDVTVSIRPRGRFGGGLRRRLRRVRRDVRRRCGRLGRGRLGGRAGCRRRLRMSAAASVARWAAGSGAASVAVVGWLVGSGSDVGFEAGGGVPAGAAVRPATAVGDGDATADVGAGLGDAAGADGDATDDGAGDSVGAGSASGLGAGDGVVTTATGGGDPERCCRPMPPTLSAMVARTRFRTPRLEDDPGALAGRHVDSDTPVARSGRVRGAQMVHGVGGHRVSSRGPRSTSGT